MNLAEYFAKNRYVAKYAMGDRVIGKWNGIPFVGSVGNDTVIFVKHKDIKPYK